MSTTVETTFTPVLHCPAWCTKGEDHLVNPDWNDAGDYFAVHETSGRQASVVLGELVSRAGSWSYPDPAHIDVWVPEVIDIDDARELAAELRAAISLLDAITRATR